jgi:hypothetical protein
MDNQGPRMVRTGDVNDVSGHNCTARDHRNGGTGHMTVLMTILGRTTPDGQSAGPLASVTVAVWLFPDVSVQPTVTLSPG